MVWSKHFVAHLIIFGCESFMHVPKEKRSKLDNKAEKCIFVGYKDGIKGYKENSLQSRYGLQKS